MPLRTKGVKYPVYECGCVPGAYRQARKDGRPFGIPADKLNRQARSAAHAAFDQLWKSGRMGRNDAYVWLSRRLNIPEHQAHMRFMNTEQCIETIRFSTFYMLEHNITIRPRSQR